jgi:hypothetical protein
MRSISPPESFTEPGALISPLIRFDTPVKFATNRFSGLL